MIRMTEEEYEKKQKKANEPVRFSHKPYTARWIAKSQDPAPKKSKFRNIITVRDGIKFHSIKEANRYEELQRLEHDGDIRDLRRQVKYALVVNGFHIADYIADAVYVRHGIEIIEDTKSPFTRKDPYYRLKKKLFQALFSKDIKEV